MADQNGPRDPATPEEIWNILRKAAEIRNETDQMLKRLGQETDRRTQENDRRMQENACASATSCSTGSGGS